MPLLRIVLDRPRNPENVGAVLRLAANFAVEGVWLVDPCELDARGRATARHADAYLASMRSVGTLDDALADCRWAVGFTSDDRDEPTARRVLLPDLPARLAALPLGPQDVVGLVFGTEADGLTWRDGQRCTWLATIPLPGYPVLNLSHAVALALHTLAAAPPPPVDPDPADAPARRDEVERMYTLLAEVLDLVGFTNPRASGPPVALFRRMHSRHPLTQLDVRTWLKFLDSIRGASARKGK